MSVRLKAVSMFVLGALIGGAFYFLLIDSTDLPELLVMAGVAVGCGVAFVLAREQGFVEGRVMPWWLAGAWRLAWKVPMDIGIACWVALAQLVAPRARRGEFRAAPYTATELTPPDTGRRALTEALGSFTPNTIVVGVDSERGLLLVHQLRRQGPPDSLDLMKLG